MLSKIKNLNWGRIITIIVVFLVCLFAPLLYVQLVLGDVKDTNYIKKTLIVLLGSRIITILTTWFVAFFKTLDDPQKDIYGIYISCLISYIIAFSYLLILTADFSYLMVIFLLLFDFVSEYMSITAFKNTDLKNFLADFFKNLKNYASIAISLIIILFMIIKILIS